MRERRNFTMSQWGYRLYAKMESVLYLREGMSPILFFTQHFLLFVYFLLQDGRNHSSPPRSFCRFSLYVARYACFVFYRDILWP